MYKFNQKRLPQTANLYRRFLAWSGDKFLALTWVLNFTLLIVLLLWLLIKIGPSGKLVPLHYSVLVGVDVIGYDYKLYGVIFLAAVIFGLNILLGRRMFDLEKGASYLLAIGSFLTTVILGVYLILLVRLF